STPTTAIDPLSLHDALPILGRSLEHNGREYRVPSLSGLPLGSIPLPHSEMEPYRSIREVFQAINTLLQEHALCSESTARLQTYRSEEHTSELQSRENLVCRL